MFALVLVFAIRGLFRGVIAQIFGLIGVIAGLWLAGWISQRVGWQWHTARPAVVFSVLKWLIAAFAAITVAALFQWWGRTMARSLEDTPVGWIDRPAGALMGFMVGILVSALIVLTALVLPLPRAVGTAAAHARISRPLMTTGAALCRVGGRVPGSAWLGQRFAAARARADRFTRTF